MYKIPVKENTVIKKGDLVVLSLDEETGVWFAEKLDREKHMEVDAVCKGVIVQYYVERYQFITIGPNGSTVDV